MKKKMVAMIMTAALATLTLAGCTPEAAEAEVTYKVVGGISEPTRVWNEVAEDTEVPEEETPTEEVTPAECPGAPEYTPSEPEVADTGCAGRYMVKEPNEKLSFTAYAGDSEKFDAIRELAGGEFVQVTGKTTKGWYALSDGSYIHSYVAEYSPEKKQQVAQTQPQTQAAPAESQPAQESRPVQEQTYEEPQQQVAEQPTQETTTTDEYVNPFLPSAEEEQHYQEMMAEIEADGQRSANCNHDCGTHVEEINTLGVIEYVTVCNGCGALM